MRRLEQIVLMEMMRVKSINLTFFIPVCLELICEAVYCGIKLSIKYFHMNVSLVAYFNFEVNKQRMNDTTALMLSLNTVDLLLKPGSHTWQSATLSQ